MTAPTPPEPTRATPYAMRTARLHLRCYELTDAHARHEAVASSGEHLAVMARPGTYQARNVDEHLATLRRVRAAFDGDGDRAYAAFAPGSGTLLGEACLLRRAGIAALEVGYWLRRDATGQGYATESAAAMLKTAFAYDGCERVDLLCRPDNDRSAAVARRLGFVLEGRLRARQIASHHERGDLLCFSMLRAEYPASPAASLPLELFDALGRPLPWPADASAVAPA